MANDGKTRKVQGILNFASNKGVGPTSCKLCGMAYHSHLKPDRDAHQKYHSGFVNGRKWGGVITPLERIRARYNQKDTTIEIIRADASLSSHVSRVEKLLEFVNSELGAPPANDAWKKHFQGSIKPSAFVAIVQSTAVGMCITEPIIDVGAQGKWMVCLTQELVPNQTNKAIALGISRIWVAPKWRRYGIGRHLLRAVCNHLVHGVILQPREVAFSQPSTSGIQLAKSFNGVKHKSGEVLLPVYIENA